MIIDNRRGNNSRLPFLFLLLPSWIFVS